MGNAASFLTRTARGRALTAAAALALWILRRRRRAAHRVAGVKYGPRATDGLLAPGDADYDKQMQTLWGGPAPKHFAKCYEEWPAKYGVGDGLSRTALVTGSTNGIGFYVAKLLAHLGYEVIIPARPGLEGEAAGAARAITSAHPAAKVTVPSEKLDLNSFASVRAFAAGVRSTHRSLDLLCVNAGRGGSRGDPREETGDGVEAVMQVNAVAHFLLCAELLPLLRAAPAARVVVQSSGCRFLFQPKMKHLCPMAKFGDLNGTDAAAFNAFHQYCLSKACTAFLMLGLNTRLAEGGVGNITALLADPGMSATGLSIQNNPAHSLVGLPDGWVRAETFHAAGQHASDGALPMVLACVDPGARGGDWYTPRGGMTGLPTKGDPVGHSDANTDPLNPTSLWPAGSCEAFWKQAAAWTQAQWDFGIRGDRAQSSL